MWAGNNWRTGMLINGRRYQRPRASRSVRFMDYDSSYDEDIYAKLW